MATSLRRLALFLPPAFVVAVELAHPIPMPPIYPAVVAHLPWWLYLHVANLALFPLLGLAAWLLLQDVRNRAATWSRVAIALYIPLYAAFDALVGIGTGVLVQSASGLAEETRSVAESLIDAYWASGVFFALAALGSIAWVIAMLAAAVAVAAPERRRLAALVAIVSFPIGGWAETNLFLPSRGHVPMSWWLVTGGLAVAMFLATRPALAPALLALAGSLFGAGHFPPTGPLGAACFLAAAVLVERGRGRVEAPADRSRRA